jgi:hypothetical protein
MEVKKPSSWALGGRLAWIVVNEVRTSLRSGFMLFNQLIDTVPIVFSLLEHIIEVLWSRHGRSAASQADEVRLKLDFWDRCFSTSRLPAISL